ncbi:hypothetical protein AAG906_030315 [Vitis piasezkii]
MTTRNADSSHGDGGAPLCQPAQPDQMRSRAGNMVFKSGPLFISSKGIGWTSWKKRWFILTRTSLVFFRSDPSAIPQKGSEVNLTLGGIDLNNSGSVDVKADKKLLTVLFPDGRDGRAFTLKAETLEDLYEWKAALENALSQAPSAALVMGQNGVLKNDQAEAVDGSTEQLKDKLPAKSSVLGRPILLALEDADGTPSFLEKALRFIEEHGVKIEGILRQAADVDDVERRIREYEKGKNEFSPDEDPHIIADCVKYVLRELPSSPVPASCCNALLEACRTDRNNRVNAMRGAICETFPEPNRRLLQRILMMMQTVASHKAENRMSSSAVSACMAPLLLRPLLAGDCELENDFDVGGDGSAQLLQAAAAANHAQAIVITLLEEYNNMFGEASMSADLYTDSEESGCETEEQTDDDDDDDDDDEILEDDGYDDVTEDPDADTDDDLEHSSNGTCSESGNNGDDDLCHDKDSEGYSSSSKSSEVGDGFEANQKLSSSPPQTSLLHQENVENSGKFQTQSNSCSAMQGSYSGEQLEEVPVEASSIHKLAAQRSSPHIKKSTTIASGPMNKRPTVWGRTPGRKNLSMESIDYVVEDEVEIQRLEAWKADLQNRIAEESKENAVLQASLERRKRDLHERRQALEQDVARLQEQLQKERDLRTALEAGLNMSQGPLPISATIDGKVKAELEEVALTEADVINLKQRADDLSAQLNQQCEVNCGPMHDSCSEPQRTQNHQAKLKDKQKDVETTSTSHLHEKSTRNKVQQDACMDGADRENKKHESKNPPQNQQLDPARSSCSSKFVGAQATSSAADPAVGRSNSHSNSKKSGTRNEGSNSTTSALSKLTTRLNFLKERRTQIANEIQNMDKGRSSSSSSNQAAQNPERGRGSEGRQPVQNMDKSQASEVQSLQNTEKGKGPDCSQSLQNQDKPRKSDAQPQQKPG